MFYRSNSTQGDFLWMIDESPVGATQAMVVRSTGIAPFAKMLEDVGGRALVAAYSTQHQVEPWISDGTPSGSSLLRDISGPTNTGAVSSSLAAWGDRIAFAASNGSQTRVWSSDGSEAGTAPEMSDIAPGTNLAVLGLQSAGSELYAALRYTPSGGSTTQDVVTIAAPGGVSTIAKRFGDASSWMSVRGSIGGRVIVSSPAGAGFDRHVWSVGAGANSGEELVPATGQTPRNAAVFAPTGGTLTFSATDVASGNPGLWSTDGTAAGTVFRVFNSSSSSESPVSPMSAIGESVVYWRAGNFGPSAICMTSPTETVCNITGNVVSFLRGRFVTMNNLAYFHSLDGPANALVPGLFATDGITASPQRVATLTLDGSQMVACDGVLYFPGDDAGGRELWRSDGTSMGTYRVKDIRPGTLGSGMSALTAIGSEVYFLADDGTHGREVWVTDGTESGTRMVADLEPGASSTGFTGDMKFIEAGGQVYFACLTRNRGYELWGISRCAADFNHNRVVTSQDFFDFLGAFFADSPSADTTGDGMVNSQDFFAFLGSFFQGC